MNDKPVAESDRVMSEREYAAMQELRKQPVQPIEDGIMPVPAVAASVKRLHPSLGDTWGMRASDDGEYVAYTDYVAAIAERDALEKGLAKMSEMYAEIREQAERTMKDLVRESRESNRLRHDNAALREQVERYGASTKNQNRNG